MSGSFCLKMLAVISMRKVLSSPLFQLGEDLGELVGGGIDGGLEDGVGLADELHVAVLDAVVDHLHVVAGAVGTHVTAAGLAFGDGGDLGVDGRDDFPAFGGAAGHDAGAFERAFFAAGDADAEEVDAFFLEGFFAALRCRSRANCRRR